MPRGKRLGVIAVFHNYNCNDKKDCLKKSNCKEKIPYASLKSMQRRRERSDLVRRNPDLDKVLYRLNNQQFYK